jgi:redox-sensitive bicupin YhaK (pirin superfamily)
MPAVQPENILLLPRVQRPNPALPFRKVEKVVSAPRQMEGAGFVVRRAFPNAGYSDADPFLLLDHLGEVEYAPGEAKGAPWHPHRGFETVTYIIDGAFAHHDSTGGGGLIADGATQWMTAGSGILHDEMPTEELVMKGGLFHGLQLWVNLPSHLKMTPPRYQNIEAQNVALLASEDGGALLRLIAGDLAGHEGPGVTWTPIVYVHATVSAGAQLELPWRSDFNALAYVIAGSGTAGPEKAPLREGQLAVFGPGQSITVAANQAQDTRSASFEVILLGGQPIREPTVFYGPFVMNTREEIMQAVKDYQAGKLGTIPASYIGRSS